MELKTLWLGLVLSLGAFAVKTGLGWAYVWAQATPRRSIWPSLIIVAAYGLIFFVIFSLLSKINILAHYETLKPLWQNGSTLHWLTAIMLFIWGLILLRRKTDCCPKSRGWLALVIPCPVCISVLFMAISAMLLYFPEQAAWATAGLFAAFMTLAALSALLMLLAGRSQTKNAEENLGLAMLLMSAYFMLAAVIMPQFTEVSKVYRLAAYGAENNSFDLSSQGILMAAVVVLMGSSFFINRKKIEVRL